MTKTPIKIAQVVFLVIGLIHLYRLAAPFEVLIAGWPMPLWINGLAACFSLGLSGWLWKILK